MKTVQSEFTWADAWILLSIIYKSPKNEGATLCGIVEVGDGINHAIFTHGELDLGLARLIEAGFVIRSHDKFQVSQIVVAAYGKIAQKNLSSINQMHELEHFLKTKPWDSSYRPLGTSSGETVSVDAFQKAVKDYQYQFRKNLHELRRTKS
jgi:hypothetical protein